jgi:hypothetical protein
MLASNSSYGAGCALSSPVDQQVVSGEAVVVAGTADDSGSIPRVPYAAALAAACGFTRIPLADPPT